MKVHVLITSDYDHYTEETDVNVNSVYFDYELAKSMQKFMEINRQYDHIVIKTMEVQ